MASDSSETSVDLPEPTTDMMRARRDLELHGYCLVADALTPAELSAVRSRLVDVAAREAASGEATLDSGGANQRVWQLLNRGSEFRKLAEHPIAMEFMRTLLGGHVPTQADDDGLPNFLLSNLGSNIAGPGGTPQFVHADQLFVPLPWPPFPMTASVMWMLDDFTEANGATRIVPGTHTTGINPTPDAATRTVPAEGAAGTALVFDGRVWHGTGANTTKDRRHGILAYYTVPWLRQQENSPVSVSNEVVAEMTPTLRRLIGFDSYVYYGMIDGVRGAATRDLIAWRASR